MKKQSELILSIPSEKSWIIILFSSMFLLQSFSGFINLFDSDAHIPMAVRLIFVFLMPVFGYFSLKLLLWQLAGKTEIRVNDTFLIIKKSAPLTSKTRQYHLSEITQPEVYDVSVSTGPIAMLQLLKITGKIKIQFNNHSKSHLLLRISDWTQAVQIKNSILSRMIEKKGSQNEHHS